MEINELDYFIWKGINSLDSNCDVYELPPIEGTQKQYNYKNIGNRVVTDREGNYQTRSKIVKLYYTGDNSDKMCNWLCGIGKVTFSNQPEKYFKAYISNKIPFTELISNEVRELMVPFECEPFAYFTNGLEKIVLLEVLSELNNPGNSESEPVITVFGQGDINLIIGQQVIKLKNVNEYITLDTPILDAYKNSDLKNSSVIGEFPILPLGRFAIRWEGKVDKIDIVPNWRCL